MSGMQDPTEVPKYFVDQQGTLVVDKDWIERKFDIIAYMVRYPLPGDMGEMLFLEVQGHNWRLEGREIVLAAKPTQFIRDAIVLHYRSRSE